MRAHLLPLALAAPAAADPLFQGLGFPPDSGGARSSYALGISADGATVIGGARFIPAVAAYGEWTMTWTAAQGPVFSPGRNLYSTQVNIASVSNSGAVVACWSGGTSPGFYQPYGNSTGFPFLPFAISPGGDFIVGSEWLTGAGGAARWSAQTGYQTLGGQFDTAAKDVSADGSILVGGRITNLGGGFVWTQASGFTLTGGIAGSFIQDSDLLAVSADGSLAAGWAFVGSGLIQPVRWRPGRGLQLINNLFGTPEGLAFDVSGNGDVIVGYGSGWHSNYVPPQAWLWDRVRGTRSLKGYLVQLGSTDVADWSLQVATAISADGRTIAGIGLNPQGEKEAFIAHIPGFCYANCDLSTTPPALTVNDFACFLNRFAAGDPYANCDDSTTPPGMNVNDFICFLNRFIAGCP